MSIVFFIFSVRARSGLLHIPLVVEYCHRTKVHAAESVHHLAIEGNEALSRLATVEAELHSSSVSAVLAVGYRVIMLVEVGRRSYHDFTSSFLPVFSSAK